MNSVKMVLCVLISLVINGAAQATTILWSDDFSDGNDTANPQWTHLSLGTGLNPSWSVVDDGTGNMVYQLGVETDGLNRASIASYVIDPIPPIPLPPFPDGGERNRPVAAYRSNSKGILTAFDPTHLNAYALITDIIGPDDAHKEFAVSLARIDSGIGTILASTIMPFTMDWMSDYIEVVDGRVRAKKWLTSQPEPANYLFDVADNTYNAGLTGIFVSTTPDNPSVTWQFDDISGSASVPEPSSTLSLLTLGTLGAASTLKRKLKSSKSTEKELEKVG